MKKIIIALLCAFTYFVAAKTPSIQTPKILPDPVVSLIMETSPQEHRMTIGAVINELDVRLQTIDRIKNADEALLLKKQIRRCKHFEKVLPVSKNLAPNAKLKKILVSLLQEERHCLRNNNPKELASIKKTWSDVESLVTRELHEKVDVQNFIIELLITMVIVSGESYAQQLFSADDKAVEDKLTAQITAAQNAYTAQSAQLQNQATQSITALTNAFPSAVANVTSQFGAARTLFSQEITYINKLAAFQAPASELVTSQISYDLVYGASHMVTPPNGYTWHNIYQNADWAFDAQLNGFIQRGASSQGSQPGYIRQALCGQWRGTSGTGPNCIPYTATGVTPIAANPDVGAQNYIFTEYYTNQPAYQIQVEVTLINCVFPFCAGIMFNLARWISGAFDRMFTHRLVALYGTQDSTGKITVGLYGGQTALISNQIPIPPLKDIMELSGLTADQSQTELLYTLNDTDIQGLSQDPLTFVITISNTESNVTVTLDKKTDTATQNLYGPSSLSKLSAAQNQLMFWYHGIGFMAPGCQAFFKIIQPSALTYTADQITAFAQKIMKVPTKKNATKGSLS